MTGLNGVRQENNISQAAPRYFAIRIYDNLKESSVVLNYHRQQEENT